MSKACIGLVWLGAAAVAGCVAPIGASNLQIPRDARNVCVSQCGTIGMGLTAVAIMANNIGCVCQGASGAPPVAHEATPGAASATAGMATIAMLREEEEEEQAQRQQQQQQQQQQQLMMSQ
jgi:hypothetical protein